MANIKIMKIASSAKYRLVEQFQSFSVFRTEFLFYNLDFLNKFINFPNCKIPKIL